MSRRVEIVAPLVDGGEIRWDGEFAAEKLAEYENLASRVLEGWQIIHELLGDDWGAPPVVVRIVVDGKEVVRIPFDRP